MSPEEASGERTQTDLRAFQSAVEQAGHAIYWTDRTGSIQYVNEAFESQTGYTEAEAVGNNANILQSGYHDDRFYEELWDTILNGDVWSGEILNRRKDGETYIAKQTISPVENADGDIVRFVAVNEDVTDLREAQQELELQRNRIETLFEAVPVPIALVTFDGGEPEVAMPNGAFVEMFGTGSDGVDGGSIDDRLVNEADASNAERINDRVRRGETVREEVVRQTEDGESRTFLLHATPLAGTTGVEALVAYVDITAQKRAAAKLERKNAQLEEFAEVVSHDLRTPLNVAMGHLDFIEDEAATEHVAAVRQAHARMGELIENILMLAREGREIDDCEHVDLASLVADTWEAFPAGDATLRIETTRHLRADRARLRQLLDNLFRNAIEHADAGVTITIGDHPGGFFVADDGPGIPEEDRPNVFESGYTTTDEGTGFGLSIVEEIAKAHGWEVRLTESESGGARFEFHDVELTDSDGTTDT
ncbi:hypothetical protein JCM17823_11360 [Halorubrum gandharaense]